MKTAHRILWALALVLGLMLLVPRAEAAEGTCGSGVTWKLDEATGHMTVSGTGKMTSASGWSAYKEQLIHLTVESRHLGVKDKCKLRVNFTQSLPVGHGVLLIADHILYHQLLTVSFGDFQKSAAGLDVPVDEFVRDRSVPQMKNQFLCTKPTRHVTVNL